MQTIRTFIALPIEDAIRQRAKTLIDRCAQAMSGIRWVEPSTMHVTLKFLGDVDNRQVPAVCRVAQRLAEPLPPFHLQFRGVGGFPQLQRANVLWIGVIQGQEVLEPLVAAMETEYAKLGFKPEPRSYRAHLTIGRLPSGRKPSDALLQAMERFAGADFGTMCASQINVMASYLEKQGPTYNVMDRIMLGQPTGSPLGQTDRR
jgi:RNA 2',3'-cyclic 3'-phosphodiesterase